MTIAETLRDAARRLADAGIENPRLEARLLLAHALGRRSEDLIRDLHDQIEAADFPSLLARRAAHEPLALILGWREFWSLRFAVSPATLIPRPDSETVVEAALALFPDPQAPVRVLDLGTGTGCLLLAFLHDRPAAFGVGLDKSEPAAVLARQNAIALALANRAAFLAGDWAAPIAGRFDLVLSNPPYIPDREIDGLMPEVRLHEPMTALTGGPDGLDAYRALIRALPRLLSREGAAVLELGVDQFDAVAGLAEAAGFQASARRDLPGIARALILRIRPLKLPIGIPI